MRAGRLHTASSHSDDSSLLSHTRHHPHPHPNRRYHPPPRGASFLLSFEPLVDKYALLLAKGTKRFVGSKKDIAVPLGRHHKRGVVLPFAVSPAGGDINPNPNPSPNPNPNLNPTPKPKPKPKPNPTRWRHQLHRVGRLRLLFDGTDPPAEPLQEHPAYLGSQV